MVPLFWKWSSVGQIWSQIKKLIFLEIGEGWGGASNSAFHPGTLMYTLAVIAALRAIHMFSTKLPTQAANSPPRTAQPPLCPVGPKGQHCMHVSHSTLSGRLGCSACSIGGALLPACTFQPHHTHHPSCQPTRPPHYPTIVFPGRAQGATSCACFM